ncbi:MAG TPA: DUF1801 domain-containing protein [Agriterribacter sp.]|nr:DUF1801 domain-containing protein [Chitinophagaceae bacterium]HRP31959.1 DUF1801 domain-containing protein [Agriterribacter sp.]
MAKTDYNSVNQYHNAFPVEIKNRMQVIRHIIHEVAQDTEEVISYQIPAFKVGKAYLVYYSAYAKHISLSSPWSQALLNEFANELGRLKVSRAAIQFPNNQELPVDLIKKIILFRLGEVCK